MLFTSKKFTSINSHTIHIQISLRHRLWSWLRLVIVVSITIVQLSSLAVRGIIAIDVIDVVITFGVINYCMALPEMFVAQSIAHLTDSGIIWADWYSIYGIIDCVLLPHSYCVYWYCCDWDHRYQSATIFIYVIARLLYNWCYYCKTALNGNIQEYYSLWKHNQNETPSFFTMQNIYQHWKNIRFGPKWLNNGI